MAARRRQDLDLDELRTEIDSGLRTRRYLGYYESREWAEDAEPVLEMLRRAVETQPSAELVDLLRRAIRNVVSVILHADDSDGLIGDLAGALLELHLQACNAGVADPKALARWMVRFSFDDQDFFGTDPVRYASALGDHGLAVYRREVAKRRAAGSDAFALRYAEERLAVLDRDVEAVVRLYGEDLDRPYHFIRLAEAIAELGRDDDVVAWSRRGIDETDGWQVAQLYDLIASVYERRGDREALWALRREEHERMPSARTYGLLRAAGTATGTWAAERVTARAVLQGADLGGLVDVLLEDREPESAWRVMVEHPEWDPGPARLKKLAKARQKTNPSDAYEVYLRLADDVLKTADRGAYLEGARILRNAATAARAAGRVDEFVAHVAALRERYRRRPTLMSILDGARFK